MPKKADKKRQKRRHQHQAAQTGRRREEQQFFEERVEAVAQALEDLVDLAGSGNLEASDVAARVAEAMASNVLLRAILASDGGATEFGRRVCAGVGREGALALAGALADRMGQQPEAAWPAVALAEEAEDLEAAAGIAGRLLGQAPPAGDDSFLAPMAAELASILRLQGRLGEALELLEDWCARDPEDGSLQQLRARCLGRLAALEGEDPTAGGLFTDVVSDEQRERAVAARTRMADRTLFDRLGEAVEAFIARDPGLAGERDAFVADFLDQVRDTADLGPLDECPTEAAALAAERFWLRSDSDDPSGERSAVGRLAADPDTPPEVATAASDWLDHVRYGLWLGDWDLGRERGSLWVADIVTRRVVYAAMAPGQMADLPRWTVLAGTLAPVGGVWRSGPCLLALEPALADEVAENVLFTTERVVSGLARERGLKAPRLSPDRRRRPRPHGVLSEMDEEMDEAEAEITNLVLGSFLDQVVGLSEIDRRRAPVLTNTDGHPLEVITATFPVEDVELLRKGLLADPDFEGEEHVDAGGPDFVRWLGRVMTPDEAASARARLRAEAATQGWGPVEDDGGPQRWVRGTLHLDPDGVEVEVNSQARLEALSEKLKRLGAGPPAVTSRVDPSLDMAWEGRKLRTGRSSGREVDEAWAEEWVKTKVPALEGATPLAAARDSRRVVLLEKLLRQFEHDADVAAAAGEVPLDVDALRDRLGMRDGPWISAVAPEAGDS